jgi:hypothetical protein
MFEALRRAPSHDRRMVITVAVAMASVVMILAVPIAARASTCAPGDFCIYANGNFTGGLYHYAGSDGNLGNDFFENADTATIVSNNGSSVRNYGFPGPYSAARFYDGLWSTGASLGCLDNAGGSVSLGEDLAGTPGDNRISSYEWFDTC